MTSWEIIRDGVARPGQKPGLLGRQLDLAKAARIFVALDHLLVDAEAAREGLDAEPGVKEALAMAAKLEGAL